MKLYIPEIGDTLKLTKPWTFKLYKEYRNEDYWKRVDGDNSPEYVAYFAKYDAFQQKRLVYWSEIDRLQKANMNNAERQKLIGEQYKALSDIQLQYNEEQERSISVDAILPVDTVLAVDRIYIRKGASDFSSLTFRITECSDSALNPKLKVNGKKQKVIRFWAKLKDVNEIEI